MKEFLNLKVKLADYFDESRTEDIFDYIPPQKTNQIFTPKWVVKKMVDLLEQENPGCFDDPGKTFLDPYMKSGLYITEIGSGSTAARRCGKPSRTITTGWNILYQAGLRTCPDRDHLPHCHQLHSGLCKGSRHHRPPYPSGGYAEICQGGHHGKGTG